MAFTGKLDGWKACICGKYAPFTDKYDGKKAFQLIRPLVIIPLVRIAARVGRVSLECN